MAGIVVVPRETGCGGGCRRGGGGRENGNTEEVSSKQQHNNHISILDLLIAALRKSMAACRIDQREEMKKSSSKMEIGWPTDVQHLTHVTFDRFHGFLGLPVEFQVEIPCRVPSAR